MIKSLNAVYQSENLIYWCNALGEINIPWKPPGYPGHTKELPEEIRQAYGVWQEGEIAGINDYVVSYNGMTGIAYNWLVDYDWINEECGEGKIGSALYSAAEQLEKKYPYAIVFIGMDTDPEGHELLLFIPLDKLEGFRASVVASMGAEVYDAIKTASSTVKDRYLGFIRAEYIRDAQFFNGESYFDNNGIYSCSDDIDIYDEEHEDRWSDINGPVLVFDDKAESEESVIERLKSLYSCSKNEFMVIKVEQGDNTNVDTTVNPVYHYETGHDEPEILGSGSCKSFIRVTTDEKEAFDLYNESIRDYLVRWHMEDDRKVMETWDPVSKSWLPESIF